MQVSEIHALSDDQLIATTERAAAECAIDEARLVALIAEVDRRKLYRRAACSSTFAYCVERLGLSEDQAYKRISVARLCRKFPRVLEWLAAPAGERVHLSGLTVLAPTLGGRSPAEVEAVLARAAGKSKRQIEKLVAELAPRPEVPEVIRRLPEKAMPALQEPAVPPAPKPVAASQRAVLEPLAPARYKVQLTVDQALHDDIEQLRDLLAHRAPGGGLAEVIGWAVRNAKEALLAERFAITERPRACRPPRSGSRTIPADVKRTVYRRDGGRCTFVDDRGRRCSATGRLEFHHHEPHARGGAPSTDNLSLRCQAHNQYQAELDFGATYMVERRRKRAQPGPGVS